MRLSRSSGGSTSALVLALAATAALPLAAAKSAWAFADGTVSISAKGAGVGAGVKEKLSTASPIAAPLTLSAADTLTLALTTNEGKTAKRPHQAFLTLTDAETGLEDSLALQVKSSGKAKLDLSHKDIAPQLLASSSPLRATLTLASFGSADPFSAHAFSLAIAADPAAPLPADDATERYEAQPPIAHTFRAPPRSPEAFFVASFACFAFTMLPVLLGLWLTAGVNVAALPEAFAKAPVAHAAFLGSLLGLEGVLCAYYVGWTLFQTLPVLGAFGVVAFLSGSRALREVQGRRLAGKR